MKKLLALLLAVIMLTTSTFVIGCDDETSDDRDESNAEQGGGGNAENAGETGSGDGLENGNNNGVIEKNPAHELPPTDGLIYLPNIDGESHSVSKYTGTSNIVNIPSTYQGKPVTKIDVNAFYKCTNITSVTIGNNIKIIDNAAFAYCTSLTDITFGNSVVHIDNGAFAFCSSLTNISIPNSVEFIGLSAFNGCTSLTSITLGNNLKNIGIDAFLDTGYYNNNSNWNNNVLYINKYLIKSNNMDSNYTIENGTIGIANEAFKDCDFLSQITIPSTLIYVGENAFKWCDELTSINYLGNIGSWCEINFLNNYSNPLYSSGDLYINNSLLVGDIKIPEGVIKIPKYAFKGTHITNVIIPDSVKIIEEGAFNDCKKLISLEIGKGVINIENYVCLGCDLLVEIINRSELTITESDISAFNTLEIHTGKSKIVNKNEYVFYTVDGVNYLVTYTGKNKILTLPSAYNGENYVINDYAFYNNTIVNTIIIPNGVTAIGYSAFYGCTELHSVTISNSIISIGRYAFQNCENLTSAEFINPSIWKLEYFDIKTISAQSLSNSDITAKYLKSYYCDYRWTKELI